MKLVKTKRQALIFIFTITILSLGSFWRVLTYGMWVDDSYLLWSSLFNISSSYWYYNHPGLPLEFLLLSHIFGTQYMFWQLTNILLRVANSFCVALFAFKLTKSRRIGILSGIFFAVSYLGLEVVDAPIMNIASIAAIPMLLSLCYFIDIISKQKNIKKSIVFFFLSFILDPGRSISLVLVIPIMFFLLKKKKGILNINKKAIVMILISLLLSSLAFAAWFVCFEPNAQITQGLVGLTQHTSLYIGKLTRVGNLFGAIGNMFIGLMHSMRQDFQDTGYYSRIFGFSGLVAFLLGCISLGYFLKYKIKYFGFIGFFILWTFLFYLPNWFSEPRAPMAGPHRYVFLSSIGLVCLIAYLLSLLKNKNLFLLLVLSFIALNVWKANTILAYQATYRAQSVVDTVWNPINKAIPQGETGDIFVFSGEQPWLSQTVQLFGASRFMLMRKYTKTTDAPLLLSDSRQIQYYLCRKKSAIPLSHLYAWEVKAPGIVVNKTEDMRKLLQTVCL